MKKLILSLVLFTSQLSFARGSIQNSDVKSLSDLQTSVATTTGTVSTASACITSVGSTAKLAAGQYIYDSTTPANITSGVTIVAIPGTCSAGQIQMTSNAAGNGTGDTITFGGPPSELINDTKLWLTSVTPNQQLSTAITKGLIGGTGGSKNYLSTYGGNIGNGNFEQASTTGWSLFNTTLTSGVPTGSITLTAGSVTTFGVSTTSPLAGTYSLNAASSSTWTAGQGFISNAFTIDNSDKSKMMTVTFSASVLSGASNAVFAGNNTNTFAIYIYDVTNSAWIQTNGAYALNQSIGVQPVRQVTFQTTSNSTQYQLAIMSVNASSGAVSMLFDDFTVGPQASLLGPAMSDMTTATCINSWTTNTTTTCKYKRIGESALIYWSMSLSGAPNNVSLSLGLPSGLSIDTTKMPTTNTAVSCNANALHAGTAILMPCNYLAGVVNVLTSVTAAGSNTAEQQLTTTNPFTWGTGDTINAYILVPITGWSSNSLSSSDIDTREVSVQAFRSGTQSGVNTNNSVVQIAFNATNKDTHGAYNTSSSGYVVPVTGDYNIATLVDSLGTTNVLNTGYYQLQVRKGLNGASFASASVVMESQIQIGSTSVNGFSLIAAGQIAANTGDILYVGIYGSGNNSASTYSLIGNSTDTYFHASKISGPATVTQAEQVAFQAYNLSGQSIATATTTLVTGWTVSKQTHGTAAFNPSTGVFTAPTSGWYQFNGEISYTTSGGTPGTGFVNFFFAGTLPGSGVNVTADFGGTYGSTTAITRFTGMALKYLNAGDTCSIQVNQSTGSTQTLNSSNTQGNVTRFEGFLVH